MQFTDLGFLIVFLPVTGIVYYLVKSEYRKYVLLPVSLIFYACGSPFYFVFLCISIGMNYVLAKLLIQWKEKGNPAAKLLFGIAVLLDLCPLLFYKYSNFIIDSLNRVFKTEFGIFNHLLPLGISFYTFKAISYLADVYRGKIRETSFIDSSNYLSFFGQIQSGPISRYDEFTADGPDSSELFFNGIVRFMTGFSKKVILADVLSKITIEIFDQTSLYSTALVWLGSVCYSLQLYYDFSGYSDMAIGIGNMFGIRCRENFDYPYITGTVSEFWRRWHISLGNWFRDYVYIPLGGSRVKNGGS